MATPKTAAYIKFYIRQQQILTHLGFYSGKIDGRWGPKTVSAKKKFERDASFKPCIPSFGQPFGFSPPYPHKIYMGEDGLLHIRGVKDDELPASDESTEELLAISSVKAKEPPKPLVMDEDNAPAITALVNSTNYRETDKNKVVNKPKPHPVAETSAPAKPAVTAKPVEKKSEAPGELQIKENPVEAMEIRAEVL